MDKIKIEAFLSVPPCSGGVNLSNLLKDIEEEFAEKIEVEIHRGPDETFSNYKLTSTPALVVGGLVRIAGVCPSRESLISALREAGME